MANTVYVLGTPGTHGTDDPSEARFAASALAKTQATSVETLTRKYNPFSSS